MESRLQLAGIVTDFSRRIAGDNRSRWHIARNDGACADNRACANRDARQHEGTRSDKGSAFHRNRRSFQRQVRDTEVVTSRAEIRFLRDGHAVVQHDRTERISVSSIAQTSAMMQGEVPRVIDASPLMHKGRAGYFPTEKA